MRMRNERQRVADYGGVPRLCLTSDLTGGSTARRCIPASQRDKTINGRLIVRHRSRHDHPENVSRAGGLIAHPSNQSFSGKPCPVDRLAKHRTIATPPEHEADGGRVAQQMRIVVPVAPSDDLRRVTSHIKPKSGAKGVPGTVRRR